MARKNIIAHNAPRYILEWGVLAAIILLLTGLIKTATPADPETYCPMGGLQAFTTYLVRGSLPCSMSSVQIMMGFALVVAIILFSKLFCSYVCPVGTVQDILIKLRRKVGLKSIAPVSGSILDSALRIFKYALLFWIFYMTATASELFCKNLDPYYAVATGFKGEITLWMSITALVLVVIGGIVVDNFFCRYICPLGALSNTLKFWPWALLVVALYVVLGLTPLAVPWWALLGALCLTAYLLEIFNRKPKYQLVTLCKDTRKCNGCHMCEKTCPNHVEISEFSGRVNSVDCNLCGDCVAACSTDALHIGITPHRPKTFFSIILPALLTIILATAGIVIGSKYELPTIDETWGIYSADSLKTQLVDPATLEEVTLENLKQIHCYGSSKAFMAKLQRIKGVYGVKTYVKHHRATVLYDPAKITVEKLSEEIYVPSRFKCNTPDFRAIPQLKVITIRTEHMPAASDLNFLGIQFKQVDSLIYGLDSQWDCPLIVRMYVDPAFDKDEQWIKSIVEKKSLDIELKDGRIKSTPVDYEFVRMEPETGTIATTEFLQLMFADPFVFVSAKRDSIAKAEKAAQYIYEIADENFTKPLIKRQMCFVSNHLSSHKGIIAVCTALNEDYVPSLQIRYCAPMTADEIWALLTMPEWTIQYSVDDIRTEKAKLNFKKEGRSYPYKGE